MLDGGDLSAALVWDVNMLVGQLATYISKQWIIIVGDMGDAGSYCVRMLGETIYYSVFKVGDAGSYCVRMLGETIYYSVFKMGEAGKVIWVILIKSFKYGVSLLLVLNEWLYTCGLKGIVSVVVNVFDSKEFHDKVAVLPGGLLGGLLGEFGDDFES